MPKYSLIVPVYNRPEEVRELLESLDHQTFRDFEVVLVEDGSSERCEDVTYGYKDLNIRYFFKPNTGPGDSRNFGMLQAHGDYFIFVDSDCILPENYFSELDTSLSSKSLDCFGGPDDAHPTFTPVQKAINHVMTSMLTTGGIRGKKNQVDKFQPRSFNMGIDKEVFEKVGGFGDIHPGEDPDWSYRIMKAGFSTGLIPTARVFHKRRIDFKKFWKQVYKFGVVRVILGKWHPGTMKVIYAFPTAFIFFVLTSLALSLVNIDFVIPLVCFFFLVGFETLLKTRSIRISVLAMFATFIQMVGYGYGFAESFFKIKILGLNERKAFPNFFYAQKK